MGKEEKVNMVDSNRRKVDGQNGAVRNNPESHGKVVYSQNRHGESAAKSIEVVSDSSSQG